MSRVTGETDFFRKTILEHDGVAQKTGAKIVIHCGNDAIPWDLRRARMGSRTSALPQRLKAHALTLVAEMPAASSR